MCTDTDLFSTAGMLCSHCNKLCFNFPFFPTSPRQETKSKLQVHLSEANSAVDPYWSDKCYYIVKDHYIKHKTRTAIYNHNCYFNIPNIWTMFKVDKETHQGILQCLGNIGDV